MISSPLPPVIASPDPIVSVHNLRFRWPNGRRDILEVSHFAVATGQRLFIRGASGSGKTTLLNLIGGIVTPQHGSVSVLGQDIGKLTSAERDAFRAAHVGLIFQMFNLIPYLSLIQNVTLPCRFSATRHARALHNATSVEEEATRLLNHLELDLRDLADRPVAELSMGQQQRVAAARALIGSPELLIADEPTSALDSDTRESFLQLVFDEAERCGIAVLFVSHDSSLEDLFDRVVLIADVNRASTEQA